MAGRWMGLNGRLAKHIEERCKSRLKAYRDMPGDVEEHANIERSTAHGGYGRRQLYELVQNGADALIDHDGSGRIEVRLTANTLYVANHGQPIDQDGVDAILASHVSRKRGTEIGRFGLGFKSVLEVSSTPNFFSRSVSFGFDAVWAERTIEAVVPDAAAYPTLRIAKPLDPTVERDGDPVLAKLMSWASTVVKLPRNLVPARWLNDDIASFPPEFLVFAPHVGELVLIDEENEVTRTITSSIQGDEIVVADGTDVDRWRVFSTTHTPTPEARDDAGELADRKSVPMIWAVPLQGRRDRGEFWAFFPTEYKTTLSGILNAPWKTNEDRQNLLNGRFNHELLEVAAQLVADSAPALQTDDDPARHLDLIPARGREAPNWADEHITESVYRQAHALPFLPNQSGELTAPTELRLPPAGLPEAALDRWAETPGRPENWVHKAAVTRHRHSRAERLTHPTTAAPVWAWLNALVKEPTLEGSAAAVEIARILDQSESRVTIDTLLDQPIVLTSDGKTLVKCRPEVVFISAGDGHDPEGLRYVHPDLMKRPAVAAALAHFGIKPADAEGAFRAQIANIAPPYRNVDWTTFWNTTRAVGHDRALELLLAESTVGEVTAKLHVRTQEGTWRRVDTAFWPGPTFEDAGGVAAWLVDASFHEPDRALLTRLHVGDAPTRSTGSTEEPWFAEFRRDCRRAYYAQLRKGQSPNEDYLVLLAQDVPRGLAPLTEMGKTAAAVLTHAILALEPDLEPWEMEHRTQGQYPRLATLNPVTWMLEKHGRFDTAFGVLPLNEIVGGPDLAPWREFLPAVAMSQPFAEALGVPASWDELTTGQLERAMDGARSHDDLDRVVAFYVAAATTGLPAPSTVACFRRGNRAFAPPNLVTAATGPAAKALLEAGETVLPTSSQQQADHLIENWGCRRSSELVEHELVAVERQPGAPLSEELPSLAQLLRPELAQMTLVRCSELRLDVITSQGRESNAMPLHVDDQTIYWSDTGEDADVLRALANHFELGLDEAELDSIVGQHARDLASRTQREIRDVKSDAARLALAVGREALLRRLPRLLIDQVEARRGGIDDETAGDLALAVYGVEALKEYKDDLAAREFDPPTQFAGYTTARRFVRRLGFGDEFAGFESPRRDATLTVPGRPELPPMHDFQKSVSEKLAKLLADAEPKRALLALPTGSGKTRVAVETVIDHLRQGDVGGPVIWIAQSDELCEQAVQTWSYVWRALGPDEPLTISRLWSSNDAVPADGHHVVVATIQKLHSLLQRGGDSYDWLSTQRLAIVDEAHFAITPTYTTVLEWLGYGRSQRKDTAPLIGLTATPFRGTSEEETKRLVGRFGKRRLDGGVFGDRDPYEVLQDMGVLANVSHELLDGVSLELTDEELHELEKYNRLPRSVEQELGRDLDRNERILSLIRGLPEDWPVLLFSTSVEHANTMAALLRLEGVPAQAISGDTSVGARQWAIERFKEGSLRVLTNYGVLTQGFDAPALRVVIVSRPTFSPTLYQQMIGRGLRGPLNGGKKECLIVNVKDTVDQFGERLAFYEFERLWQGHE